MAGILSSRMATTSGQTAFTRKLNPETLGGCREPPLDAGGGRGWVSSNRSEHCLGKKARIREKIPGSPELETRAFDVTTCIEPGEIYISPTFS